MIEHKQKKIEFGDFQTPFELASDVVALLKALGLTPTAIVEPTCGEGSFLRAAKESFPQGCHFYGYDIKEEYVRKASLIFEDGYRTKSTIERMNFFEVDWKAYFNVLPGQVLVLGNPPWVTNSVLGSLASDNLPEKKNFQGLSGFAAKTGKANFDISEWMLIRLLEALNDREGCLAMLSKTSTARKVLHHCWKNSWNISDASLHLFDASKYFGVSADAGLLIAFTGKKGKRQTACVYEGLSFKKKLSEFGLVRGELVADVHAYERAKVIEGIPYYRWRSGVKHDASAVMELTVEGKNLVNGLGEVVEIEDNLLYPLLKSSNIANGRLIPNRFVIITQRNINDETSVIQKTAPRTWRYLLSHSAVLDIRRSIIYEKRPRFSVFGVGDYAFSPWKVAISGLYKNLSFVAVGGYKGKPIVLDDTCYFIPCRDKSEASILTELLNADITKDFISSLVFFDAKRPVTIDVLKRIDLKKIAEKLHKLDIIQPYLEYAEYSDTNQQLLVFEKPKKYRVALLSDSKREKKA